MKLITFIILMLAVQLNYCEAVDFNLNRIDLKKDNSFDFKLEVFKTVEISSEDEINSVLNDTTIFFSRVSSGTFGFSDNAFDWTVLDENGIINTLIDQMHKHEGYSTKSRIPGLYDLSSSLILLNNENYHIYIHIPKVQRNKHIALSFSYVKFLKDKPVDIKKLVEFINSSKVLEDVLYYSNLDISDKENALPLIYDEVNSIGRSIGVVLEINERNVYASSANSLDSIVYTVERRSVDSSNLRDLSLLNKVKTKTLFPVKSYLVSSLASKNEMFIINRLSSALPEIRLLSWKHDPFQGNSLIKIAPGKDEKPSSSKSDVNIKSTKEIINSLDSKVIIDHLKDNGVSMSDIITKNTPVWLYIIQKGDLKLVESVFENFSFDPNILYNEIDQNALHAAINFRAYRLIPFLIQIGIDANQKDFQGRNPLATAIYYGAPQEHIDFLKEHTSVGDIFIASKTNNLKAVQENLRASPNVAKETDEAGNLALHYASRYGDQELCRLLIDHGAPILQKNKEGKGDTSLMIALKYGKSEVFDLYLHRISLSNEDFYQIFQYVPAYLEEASIYEFFLKNKYDFKDLSFMDSYHPFVRTILNKKSNMLDVFYKYDYKLPSWGYCHLGVEGLEEYLDSNADEIQRLFFERTLLIWSILSNQYKYVELLIQKGSDVNIMGSGDYWKAPIHFAVENNQIELVKLLIKSGANVNLKDGVLKGTPLYTASRKKHYELVELLLDSGADYPDATVARRNLEVLIENDKKLASYFKGK